MDDAHSLPPPDDLARELVRRAGLHVPDSPFADYSFGVEELEALASTLAGVVGGYCGGHACLAGGRKDSTRYWVVTDPRRERTVAAELCIRAHGYWTLDDQPFSPTAPGAQARMVRALAGYAAEAFSGRVG